MYPAKSLVGLQGSDALMAAADKGHVHIVQVLLAEGADVTACNNMVTNFMIQSARLSSKEAVLCASNPSGQCA